MSIAVGLGGKNTIPSGFGGYFGHRPSLRSGRAVRCNSSLRCGVSAAIPGAVALSPETPTSVVNDPEGRRQPVLEFPNLRALR